MDAFHRRVEAKISSLRAEGKEERAESLEDYLQKVDVALGDGELTKLPEVE